MGALTKKDLIAVKAGSYRRIGKGIQFAIDGNLFYSREIKANSGFLKKVLYCRLDNGHKSETCISGLKRVPNTENTYYFDIASPKTRASINSEHVYWLLRVLPEVVEIVPDNG